MKLEGKAGLNLRYFQLQLLEFTVNHILDPLLLRDVPHRGPQLPS